MLALYKEVEIYTSFAADLDATTTHILNRGVRLTELLKQGKHKPLSRNHEVLLLFAGVNGYLDKIPKENISKFKDFLCDFSRTTNIFHKMNPYKSLIKKPFKDLMVSALKKWSFSKLNH